MRADELPGRQAGTPCDPGSRLLLQVATRQPSRHPSQAMPATTNESASGEPAHLVVLGLSLALQVAASGAPGGGEALGVVDLRQIGKGGGGRR